MDGEIRNQKSEIRNQKGRIRDRVRPFGGLIALVAMGTVAILCSLFPVPYSLKAAQVLTTTGKPPGTYRVAFSVACGGQGDCATVYYGGKTVRIREVWISKPSTAATVSLNFHSAADSGGTSTNPTGVAMDTGDASPTAVVTAYTAAPTAGASYGTIAMLSMATTDTWVQDWGTLSDKALVLQAPGQGLAIYVSTATTLIINLEWSEHGPGGS
jgi:hypothetical protein